MKKDFTQLSGVRSTQKLVKIPNRGRERGTDGRTETRAVLRESFQKRMRLNFDSFYYILNLIGIYIKHFFCFVRILSLNYENVYFFEEDSKLLKIVKYWGFVKVQNRLLFHPSAVKASPCLVFKFWNIYIFILFLKLDF